MTRCYESEPVSMCHFTLRVEEIIDHTCAHVVCNCGSYSVMKREPEAVQAAVGSGW